MPSNAGSIGSDYSLGYFDANSNSLINLGDVQNVKIQAQKHDLKNMPYNGPPKYDFMPDGHKISFSIVRTSSLLEDIAVAREAKMNAGGFNYSGYLNETITNPDGSVSRYQYTGFVFFLTDHGEISRDKLVMLSGEGMASQKVQIS